MTFQMLEYFSVVSESLNISDASRKLFVSQPAVSRQIKALEDELGIQLFYRTKPKLSLTDAGLQLKEHIQKIVDMSEELINLSHSWSNVLSGTLSVGFSGNLEYEQLFSVLSEMAKDYPACSFQFKTAPLDVLEEELFKGTFDVVFCPLTNFQHHMQEEVEIQTILTVPVVLCCSVHHPLASREKVSVADLASEKFVIYRRRESVLHGDYLIDSCRKFGFSPKLDYEVSDVQTFGLIVASNMAVSVVGASAKSLFPDSVKFIPIEGFELKSIDVGAAWSKNNDKRSLKALKNVLRDCFPAPQIFEL